MEQKLILTLLGIFLAALHSVSKRNRYSRSTPYRFDLLFYIKDNWTTHVLSAVTSVVLVLTYHYLKFDVLLAHAVTANLSAYPMALEVFEAILAWLCGFAPHLAFSLLDRAGKVFTPKFVKHGDKLFERK